MQYNTCAKLFSVAPPGSPPLASPLHSSFPPLAGQTVQVQLSPNCLCVVRGGGTQLPPVLIPIGEIVMGLGVLREGPYAGAAT